MDSIILMANSGIQFYSTEAVFLPSEPAVVNDIPLPQLLFGEYPSDDPSQNEIQIVYRFHDKQSHKDCAFLLSELREESFLRKRLTLSGSEEDDLDLAGVPKIDDKKINPMLLSDLGIDNCYSEYALEGLFQLMDPETNETCTPFSRILGKWIPVPLFYYDSNGSSRCAYPSAWCRVKITLLEENKRGNRYRFDWAYDTTLAAEENVMEGDDPECQDLPYFKTGVHKQIFGLPTHVGHLLEFVSDNSWVRSYLQSLVFGEGNISDLPLSNGFSTRCRHLAYYISLFTNLRVMDVCPKVTLYNCDKQSIPVDLVLDIGNSRTCGLLVEDSDFTKSRIMGLRDLTDTSIIHEGSFDMRLAFHRTEFGKDNMGTTGVFEWCSFLRLGDEAKTLIAKSRKVTSESDRMTHHSSPKRFLWDDQSFKNSWEFLLTEGEPVSEQRDGVYVARLSEQLRSDGAFLTADDAIDDDKACYSRQSLNTLVMIEILQQAMCQINSYEYLNFMGMIDRPRKIRNIIVSCPTAMPEAEQIVLRKCAQNAMIAIMRSKNAEYIYEPYQSEEWESKVSVIPDPKEIGKSLTTGAQSNCKDWSYDEASCCQYVYLYSEIVEKYAGNCEKFISEKGHYRADFKASGYDKKALTIGSVDIGAGTTDLMICTYKYDCKSGSSLLTPIPLFWDSFYVAGDDILNEIVQKMVLRDGVQDEYQDNHGPICNALCAKYLSAELSRGSDAEAAKLRAEDLAYSSMVAFFGTNANDMSYVDRLMRVDFNIQVSVVIAQKMLDMMKNGEEPQDLTYEQIFKTIKPSSVLLEYFYNRFGIRIEEMVWSYSPERVTACIRTKMERLLKQLSVILHSFHCDVVLLAGRPMSLEAVTDLFLKYFPVSPDRLIRMLPKNDDACSEQQRHNCYKVGRWFPSHDDVGYFKDLKPVVATGAYVGYLASNHLISKLQFDMSEMKRRMVSTANYLGSLDPSRPILPKEELLLSPSKNTATFVTNFLPHFIVCKQINTEYYQARPLYSLSKRDDISEELESSNYDFSQVRFTVTRIFKINKEELQLINAYDRNNNEITNLLQLKIQSLVPDEGEDRYWLDNGAFKMEK